MAANDQPRSRSLPLTAEELDKWADTAKWAWDNSRAATLDGLELRRLVDMARDSLTRSETGRIVNDRTSADLRRFFDRVAEESLGDYPWKVETALLAVYRLGREDERGERSRQHKPGCPAGGGYGADDRTCLCGSAKGD